MAFLEKQLVIKKSKIPLAGKGLFTKKDIAKGERIIQYKGKMKTWKDVTTSKIFNGYVYYINRNKVIDAKPYLKAFARYCNDAAGLTRIAGLKNNCVYKEEGDKVYVEALRNIKGGEELFVAYGKEYWDVIKFNMKLEKADKK